MRDLLLAGIVFGSLPFILWRPVIGIYMWVWVSVMNPHRLTWDFTYDMALAQIIAVTTLIGALFSRLPKRLPVTRVTIVLFILVVWMNVGMLFAIDVGLSTPMWERVMKIMFMVFVGMYLLHTREHVQVLVAVCAGSVAFFGVKGGLFTLLSGGEYRVFGPAGSFIEENNSLALATVMTIPLLWYFYLEASRRWLRWALVIAMILCIFSALGSHSRGALLAIAAMLGVLWLKSPRKLAAGAVIILLASVAIAFMPVKWDERMRSIADYKEDVSAMGRINAWSMAYNLAKDRVPLGGGFEIYNRSVFGRYAPVPDDVHSAHSIYFQMLGEHGFLGLALFLLLWVLVWRDASWVIRTARSAPEMRWAFNLARMIQVSLAGYAVGGAFLNLAYYDVPYYILTAMVLTRMLVERELAEKTARGDAIPPAPQPMPVESLPSRTESGARGVAIGRRAWDPRR
jgi:probable O-glycosylation ligase (exosortase A-associated)